MQGRDNTAAFQLSPVPIFAALGEPTRLGIVARLAAGGPLSTIRLSAGAGISRQAVTKHLHALADAGLVRGTRVGRDRVWELRAARLAELRRYLDQISEQWDQALVRLGAFVETDLPDQP
jgi:DNA-binding transcriptional ArsR family regulator